MTDMGSLTLLSVRYFKGRKNIRSPEKVGVFFQPRIKNAASGSLRPPRSIPQQGGIY